MVKVSPMHEMGRSGTAPWHTSDPSRSLWRCGLARDEKTSAAGASSQRNVFGGLPSTLIPPMGRCAFHCLRVLVRRVELYVQQFFVLHRATDCDLATSKENLNGTSARLVDVAPIESLRTPASLQAVVMDCGMSAARTRLVRIDRALSG